MALVEGTLTQVERARLEAGITLDDGPCAPARVERVSPGSPAYRAVAPEGAPRGRSVWALTIHEGRKHQVKRMLAAVGHEVLALHRDTFGPLALGSLESGSWRRLGEDEVSRLLASVGEDGPRRLATQEAGRGSDSRVGSRGRRGGSASPRAAREGRGA